MTPEPNTLTAAATLTLEVDRVLVFRRGADTIPVLPASGDGAARGQPGAPMGLGGLPAERPRCGGRRRRLRSQRVHQ
eukprot:3124948-Pyramimonas_sp.AAC.1